jgi:beta-N-acetylhexosaminidase
MMERSHSPIVNPTLELSEVTQRIGPLFIGGMPGTTLDDNTANLIKQYHLGGIILFERNVTDPLQLAILCRDLQMVSMEASGLPLLLAIDQEGGRVARLKGPFTQFPGNAAIGESPNPQRSALHFAKTVAGEMSLVGLNMNMAPVVDVTQPNMEAHLVGRSFSPDPSLVTTLGKIVINTLQQGGIMAVAKHFPGLGKSDLDPHLHLPHINATSAEIESVHLPPFAGAIEAKVAAIMSSHAVYPALDPGKPATLSRKIVTQLLREQMHFDGLVVSDDLEMGAIAKARGLPQAAADAFEAGIDLLLICNNQSQLLSSMELMRDKALREQILPERLEASLKRITTYKRLFLHPLKKISLEAVRGYFGEKQA